MENMQNATYFKAEAGIRVINNIPLEFGQWQGMETGQSREISILLL